MTSSEELEWELIEIFDSGLFAFPIYDHASARKFINYLIRRGVLEEEIAEAIEDSTYDLSIWLNHGGKFMVGEWVIAWVNEVREDYMQERLREGLELGEAFEHDIFPDGTLDETEEDHTTDDGSQIDLKAVASLETLDIHNGNGHVLSEADSQVSGDDTDFLQLHRDKLILTDPHPPPLPPRTPQGRQVLEMNHVDSNNKDGYAESLLPEDPYEGGSAASHYTTIPSDTIPEINPLMANHTNQIGHKRNSADSPTAYTPNSTLHLASTNHISLQRKKRTETYTKPTDSYFSENGKPDTSHTALCTPQLPNCQNCTCTIHYSYLERLKENTDPTVNDNYCDLYFTEGTSRAMEFEFPTLDREGPGYIFIMTDVLHQGLSWSVQHRYKIASSRQPDRYLLEFRSRNIEIELLWQVKVKRHLKAIQEVHTALQQHCIQSNWFKCSLHAIMEVISGVARKYKTD